ncbi:terminase small subunit [Starkeya sp. ORNL1]|uniref:terminase small subunit n=1 Tax=Starkeya sp. ORNL1 TaxID=2709380 RepID=UPI001463FA7E|nr:terminase small subunit [Starkeya sp. ORNL1]QJP14620.1 terminase small subunit [Starkeya sp. ORNL1]
MKKHQNGSPELDAALSALSPRRQIFVREYLIDLNCKKAAERAGYAPRSAQEQGHRLFRNVQVAAAISIAMADRARRTQIESDAILKRWWDIANADVNDVIQYRRIACRYCHGKNHGFQWHSQREFDAAYSQAVEEKRTPPECDGGFGYVETAGPLRQCPECSGNGVGVVFALDTTQLKGSALLLYDGVKRTGGGFEIKLRDRDKALELAARHLGMFSEKLILKGDPETPLKLLLREVQGTSLQPVVNPPDDDEDED